MITKFLLVSFFAFSLGLSVSAQIAGETALRQYFEGKQVISRIDLPGSRGGIDIYPDQPEKLFDLDKHLKRNRLVGVSISIGATTTVTKIAVNKSEIEFQLDGGGYGGFLGSEAAPSAPALVPKIQREIDLENELKTEKDATKLRYLRDEINYERRRREDTDRENRYEYERRLEGYNARVADERARGGSRINLKFKKTNTKFVTAEQLMQMLENYIDFSAITGSTAPRM